MKLFHKWVHFRERNCSQPNELLVFLASQNVDLILPICFFNWKILKKLILEKWHVSYNATFIMSCDSVDKREISRLEWFISSTSSLKYFRNLDFNSYAIFRANVQKSIILVLMSRADIFKIKYDLVMISSYIRENGKWT